MKTMPAGKFKAQCLAVIDNVHDLKEVVIITKYGRPMAKLIPFRNDAGDLFGFMQGKGKIVGDVMAPLEDEWISDK